MDERKRIQRNLEKTVDTLDTVFVEHPRLVLQPCRNFSSQGCIIWETLSFQKQLLGLEEMQVRECKVRRNLHSTIKGQERTYSVGFNSDGKAAERCKPVSKFVFIKTMKTGSSTTANIMLRYGMKNNLTVAGKTDFRDTRCINFTAIDFSAIHIQLNRSAIDNVIPNAKYFTILRSPYTHLRSAFYWFKFSTIVNSTFTQFVMHLEKYNNFTHRLQQHRNGQMWFLDPRFDMNQRDNNTYILQVISKLDQELDLVMLMEYYDESILLLKKLLCWEFDDLVYHGVKMRKPKDTVLPEMESSIRKWSNADFLLYEHFNHTFWEKVKNYDGNFEKDLNEFRTRQQNVSNQCASSNALEYNSFCWRLVVDTRLIKDVALQQQQTRMHAIRKERKEKCSSI
ncbi:galactose-3-O-sulfotransferase 2-like [Saccoglossus kowalevskii]|uniref:Galactosylceramide sulfotransferase-like n=1 Tax=Saccoglossus kowalevskii TaxID=10224 RepID=A0ABM0MUM8_SACKO|nr:PREDICTED: galactosylceramide sulfotransferase-like [Saccoglossus kowalevskii]